MLGCLSDDFTLSFQEENAMKCEVAKRMLGILFVIYDMQERKIQMVNSMASNRTNKKREREKEI